MVSAFQLGKNAILSGYADVILHFALLMQVYPYRIRADRNRIGADHFG